MLYKSIRYKSYPIISSSNFLRLVLYDSSGQNEQSRGSCSERSEQTEYKCQSFPASDHGDGRIDAWRNQRYAEPEQNDRRIRRPASVARRRMCQHQQTAA